MMRTFIAMSLSCMLAACVDEGNSDQHKASGNVAPVDTVRAVVDGIELVPLTGSGVRFDGVYHYADGNLRYYMRFFERGNAAFVGGTEKYTGQLAEMLTIDVQSGWNQVHNCPVVQRNDSLFIRSMGLRGAINYFGEVRAAGDSVRFLKASQITGTRIIGAYGFLTDARLAQEKAQFIQLVDTVGR